MLKFSVSGKVTKEIHTVEDVCRMLRISRQQLRSWQRLGYLPQSDQFTFSDLIAIRTLENLKKNRVSARNIARVIESLRRRLAGVERPLSELRIVCDGKTISVQVAGRKMEAISGQFLFDFETAGLDNVKSLASKPAREGRAGQTTLRAQAEHWFQRGLSLEETGAPIAEAVEAYRKALELNPSAAGALVNLGTIYYHQHKFKEAEEHYLRAVKADPRYALAHFNLANLWDEQGDPVRARQHYENAIRLDPGYADAHYNLALLHEKTGDFLKATYHWRTYLKLDSSSSWADIARRQLDKLRQITIVRGAGESS
ncbi:MAG: tetratricopeptide repeat protein [Bryobacterales bacterium]|nr:tetratricopeptide repeat protein [Bryobacterales bacterium]